MKLSDPRVTVVCASPVGKHVNLGSTNVATFLRGAHADDKWDEIPVVGARARQHRVVRARDQARRALVDDELLPDSNARGDVPYMAAGYRNDEGALVPAPIERRAKLRYVRHVYSLRCPLCGLSVKVRAETLATMLDAAASEGIESVSLALFA